MRPALARVAGMAAVVGSYTPHGGYVMVRCGETWHPSSVQHSRCEMVVYNQARTAG